MVVGDFMQETQPPILSLGPGLPQAGRVRSGVQVHRHPGRLQHQQRMGQVNLPLEPGELSTGDSPPPHCRSQGDNRNRNSHQTRDSLLSKHRAPFFVQHTQP